MSLPRLPHASRELALSRFTLFTACNAQAHSSHGPLYHTRRLSPSVGEIEPHPENLAAPTKWTTRHYLPRGRANGRDTVIACFQLMCAYLSLLSPAFQGLAKPIVYANGDVNIDKA
uniref:Uncharacterized protein n=1 Tax=Rhipicephalus microplus TaxID=6941 RepID=A0A6G5A2K2_RHIMP